MSASLLHKLCCLCIFIIKAFAYFIVFHEILGSRRVRDNGADPRGPRRSPFDGAVAAPARVPRPARSRWRVFRARLSTLRTQAGEGCSAPVSHSAQAASVPRPARRRRRVCRILRGAGPFSAPGTSGACSAPRADGECAASRAAQAGSVPCPRPRGAGGACAAPRAAPPARILSLVPAARVPRPAPAARASVLRPAPAAPECATTVTRAQGPGPARVPHPARSRRVFPPGESQAESRAGATRTGGACSAAPCTSRRHLLRLRRRPARHRRRVCRAPAR